MELETSRCQDRPTMQMIKAFMQFNRGEFWQQHETLEEVWRAEKDEDIRNLYKGILQVGVGLHHLTRKNYAGVIKVLPRGIRYLEPYQPLCMGVEISRLMEDARLVLEQVKSLGPDRMDEVNALVVQVHYTV